MVASGSVTAGPAVTTLRFGATRTVAILRCVGVACIAAQVVIWHSFYLSAPWRLAGPLAAMAWGVAAAAYVYRRWPAWQLAVVDSAFYMVLALCARWYIPSVLRGDTSNWLDIAIVGQLVSPAWFTPAKVVPVLAAGTAASYWLGAILTPSATAGSAAPVTAAVMMLAIALAASAGRRMLFRRAVGADAALERDDRDSREQYVMLSRQTERREQERLLHDTVLNTLTALARPDRRAGDVVSRCKEDVALIERMLGDADDMSATAWSPVSGLLAAIEEVGVSMRSRGLRVSVEATHGETADALPNEVVRALTYAVREALANVAGHAGTDQAWVEISRAAGDGLEVTVRDEGRGFDIADIDPARLGLRRSIVERVADSGGEASVRSAPGSGTVVTLRFAEAILEAEGSGRW